MSQQNTSTRPNAVDSHIVDSDEAGLHIVRVDYTNGSAQILDPHGDCVAHYAPGVTRHTLGRYLTTAGWELTPGSTWTITSPPDGRHHPVRRKSAVTIDHPEPFDLRRKGPHQWEPVGYEQVLERFGPGRITIGLISGEPHTTVSQHSAIHRTVEASLDTFCNSGPLKIALAVTDDPSAEAVISLLTDGGYEPCRMCRRCWGSDLVPQHDQFSCYDRYRLPNNVANVLSPEAIAVIAGLIAPSDEVNSQGIFGSDHVWDEIRAAFPVEAFWAWVAEHDTSDDTGDSDGDSEDGYDDDRFYRPDAGL